MAFAYRPTDRMTIPNALENLDRHWAVKVVTPEDRAAAIQYGMSVLTRLGSNAPIDGDALPDFVVPLAAACVTARRKGPACAGAASPAVRMSAEQEAQRAAHIEAGAD